ncbi:hypothetical protein MTO96_011134 [Rhipicephalus appendiculatus]
MAKIWEEANHGPPKAGRAKRRAAADDNAAGPSNEAPGAVRSRGRPPQGASGEPLGTEAHRYHGGSKVAEGQRMRHRPPAKTSHQQGNRN